MNKQDFIKEAVDALAEERDFAKTRRGELMEQLAKESAQSKLETAWAIANAIMAGNSKSSIATALGISRVTLDSRISGLSFSEYDAEQIRATLDAPAKDEPFEYAWYEDHGVTVKVRSFGPDKITGTADFTVAGAPPDYFFVPIHDPDEISKYFEVTNGWYEKHLIAWVVKSLSE